MIMRCVIYQIRKKKIRLRIESKEITKITRIIAQSIFFVWWTNVLCFAVFACLQIGWIASVKTFF